MQLPPENCCEFLRGIKDDRYFDGIGFDHALFSSDINELDIEELENWYGTSINWDLQNGNALEQLLVQKKDNEIVYGFGAIRIPRAKLDAYAKRYNNKLAYEIREEGGNIYHGHILFSRDLDKSRRQTICAFLANDFVEIHKQEI